MDRHCCAQFHDGSPRSLCNGFRVSSVLASLVQRDDFPAHTSIFTSFTKKSSVGDAALEHLSNYQLHEPDHLDIFVSSGAAVRQAASLLCKQQNEQPMAVMWPRAPANNSRTAVMFASVCDEARFQPLVALLWATIGQVLAHPEVSRRGGQSLSSLLGVRPVNERRRVQELSTVEQWMYLCRAGGLVVVFPAADSVRQGLDELRSVFSAVHDAIQRPDMRFAHENFVRYSWEGLTLGPRRGVGIGRGPRWHQ